MREFAPKIIVAKPALGNKTMNMWIPFQVTTESMKDANKTGSKILDVFTLENKRKITLWTAEKGS